MTSNNSLTRARECVSQDNWSGDAVGEIAPPRQLTLYSFPINECSAFPGEKDGGVPVNQAYEFFTGLRDVGVEAELVVYPREGHNIQEYSHRIDLQNIVRKECFARCFVESKAELTAAPGSTFAKQLKATIERTKKGRN